MSKVIRVDAEVWEELQRRGIPFIDTPNTVLRRVLELPPRNKRREVEPPDNLGEEDDS